uniref:Uncharacterized protein n=1 Tax=Brassica oleracea var. oleracea TaxID=109376 RepID=A0A0D3AAJ5_BRAOL
MRARISSRILNRGSGCENGGENDGDNGGEITRAFGLAVAAEQRRTTVGFPLYLSLWQVINESGDSSYCVYEKDIATGLGIEVCLLAGSVRNAYHTKYHVYFGNTAPLLVDL